MKFFDTSKLGDAAYATLGYAIQKWGIETLENAVNIQRFYAQDPALVQLGVNVLGLFFIAPAVGQFLPNKEMATVGGQVWHFARGLKIILSKAGLTQYLSLPVLGQFPY